MTVRYALDEDYLEDEDLLLIAADDLDGSPVVTQQALADFVAGWAANDPNGVWGEVLECRDGPVPGAAMLCMTRSDSDDPNDWTYFPAAPDTHQPAAGGAALYVLQGWPLIRVH